MKIRTPKELDRLLKNYYQQEGETVQPPSSHERWAELKARLETQDRSEHTAEISLNAEAETGSFMTKRYRFFRQNKALATLAAACLLLAVAVTGLPQANPLRQYFAGMVMLSDQSEQEEGIIFQIQSVEDDLGSLVTPELGQPPEEQLRAAEMPVEEKAPSFQADGLPEDMEIEALEQYPIGAAPEDIEQTEYLEFSEYAVFVDTLKNFKSASYDDLWHTPQLPETFEFSHGHIVRSETALLDVKQVFSSADVQRQLSITQSLFPDQEAAKMAYHIQDATIVPVLVGSYEGYLLQQEQGFNTLTWLQENSIVSITGQLDGDTLFEIIESMDTF